MPSAVCCCDSLLMPFIMPTNTLDCPNRSLIIPSPTKSKRAGNMQQGIPNTVLFVSYRLPKSIYSLLLSLPTISTKSCHGLIPPIFNYAGKPLLSPHSLFFLHFLLYWGPRECLLASHWPGNTENGNYFLLVHKGNFLHHFLHVHKGKSFRWLR